MNFEKSELRVDGLVVNTLAVVVSAVKTITALENGTTFILSAAAGVAVTLPAPAAGLKYKFRIGLAFATTNWVIGTNAAAAIIEGNLVVNGAAVNGSNEKQINFVATAESLGDYAEVESDGTSWFVSGIGNSAGSITLTAP